MAAAAEPQTIFLKSPALTRQIRRLQNAKATLKTKLNARNDNQHQIDDETIDEYGAFVDSIPQGGGGIDWSEIGYSAEPQSVIDGFNYAKTIYDNWDSSQTDLSNKFKNDKNLTFMPLVDTSNSTNISGIFQNCTALTTVPQLNTQNVQYFGQAFYSCTRLKTIPALNTSNALAINALFYDCTALTTVPQLDFSKASNIASLFNNCGNLTNLGGMLNVGQAYDTAQSANFFNYKIVLSSSTLLTHDSLMNVINGLYDIATKGCNAQQLVLGATNLAKLTSAEISTCTSKGWSVS